MNPILKKSTAELAKERLLLALAEGRWSGRIPSTRMLCETLQVSGHTLSQALERLVADGILISDGPKRRLRVAALPAAGANGTPPTAQAPRVGKVLCLGREPMHLIPRIGLEFLSHLRTWLPKMDLRYHGVTFDSCRKPRSAWDRLVELEQPDQLLVLEGSRDLAKWAAAGRVPTVFLGGNPADTGIPTVGVHAGEAIEETLAELLALGHERICLPMFGRNPDFVAGMRSLFRGVFDAAGKTFVPTYHVPAVVASDPEVVWSVMAQLVATKVPTALIFFMWDEFLSAQCFLSAKGLRIPDEVSVVLLGGGESNLWYRPKLTYFAYPSERAAELAAHWIEDGPPTGNSTVSLPLKLVRGESVGPPPQK